jgi:hypothetical protein
LQAACLDVVGEDSNVGGGQQREKVGVFVELVFFHGFVG